MECRAYGICLDSQSRGYLGKDRKVSSAAGGNLSRMHKTEETAKESRLNFMYSHLRNRTLALALLSRYVLQHPAGDQGRSSGMKWPKADQTKAPEPIAATLLDRVRRLPRVQTTAPFDASPAVAILLASTGMLQFQHSFDPPVEAA